MKKYIFLFVVLAGGMVHSQTTFTVIWDQGVGGDGSFTIASGDTVKWVWGNGNPHSVTTTAGTETFDSGIISGMGTEFEFTFDAVGSTDYVCNVHSNMTGTITVEQTMGVDEKFARNVQVYPNPVQNEMTIQSLYRLASYEIYDMFGKKVGSGTGNGNYTILNTAYLKSGVYFLTATSEEGYQITKKVIKQ